jgi:putative ABC transport system permease protein
VLELPMTGRAAKFKVSGVWRDYARQHGAVVVERRAAASLGADVRSSQASLWLESGVGAEVIEARLRSALAGRAGFELSRPQDIRNETLRIFDRTFAVTYALEAVAVIIGLFALSASFAALAIARRREFGMLRHIGMTRAQIGRMLAFEGTLVSALGLLLGLALGWLISLILVHVVNRQSFHWSMDLDIPWLRLAGFIAVMLPLASLTAWAGARRAMSGDAVQAVKETS